MLWSNVNCLCSGIIFVMLFAWVCAVYAYVVNVRRLPDDPEKKDFYLAAVFLAPITSIPLLVGVILLSIVRAVLYGVVLLIFILALILRRNAFLLEWLHKKITYIGDKLLEANTFLIKLLLRPWVGEPRTI